MNAFARNNNGFLNNIPPVTRNILIINVLVWLSCNVLRGFDLADILGMHYLSSDRFYIFQFITYMFTHVSLSHLFFNMFAVFMFGSLLERVWGEKRYLTFYLVTGIGAALVQLLVTYIRIQQVSSGLSPFEIQEVYSRGIELLDSNRNFIGSMGELNALINTNMIGASGSVFGLLLAFGMMFPNAPLYLMFIPIPIKAKYFVTGYALIEFFLGVSNRAGDNVAHFAHLGGLLFGIFMILYWKKKGIGNGTRYF